MLLPWLHREGGEFAPLSMFFLLFSLKSLVHHMRKLNLNSFFIIRGILWGGFIKGSGENRIYLHELNILAFVHNKFNFWPQKCPNHGNIEF